MKTGLLELFGWLVTYVAAAWLICMKLPFEQRTHEPMESVRRRAFVMALVVGLAATLVGMSLAAIAHLTQG